MKRLLFRLIFIHRILVWHDGPGGDYYVHRFAWTRKRAKALLRLELGWGRTIAPGQ